jgi:hypothetical protein
MKKLFLTSTALLFLTACQTFAPRAPTQDNTPTAPQKPSDDNITDTKIDFDFVHTKQNCKVSISASADSTAQQTFHKKTFCLNTNGSDIKEAADLSGMVKIAIDQLNTALVDPKNSNVSVAYFSFSNKSIQKKMCELSAKGVAIRVVLDAGSGPKNGLPGQIDDLIMNNPDCLDENKKLNVTLSYLGGNTKIEAGKIWQLHHNKFLMIETPNQKVKLNFSSGNLSTFGTSLHLDHWVMINAPASSNLIRAHKCVMQGLEAAVSKSKEDGSTSKAVGQSYITEREKCFDEADVLPRQSLSTSVEEINSQISKMLDAEEIAPLYAPNNNQYVEKTFIDALGKVPNDGYIYIAIQHFLHPGVSRALTKAAERGVDVRVVMDDDALRGESDVPGVDLMIKKLVLVKGIQIRFAETNKLAGGGGALMHNKFAILNGVMTFSGAGHYTNAAMNVNWENFYFAKNKIVLLGYAKYFNELWNDSVDFKYTLSKGTEPSLDPETLNQLFLSGLK